MIIFLKSEGRGREIGNWKLEILMCFYWIIQLLSQFINFWVNLSKNLHKYLGGLWASAEIEASGALNLLLSYPIRNARWGAHITVITSLMISPQAQWYGRIQTNTMYYVSFSIFYISRGRANYEGGAYAHHTINLAWPKQHWKHV